MISLAAIFLIALIMMGVSIKAIVKEQRDYKKAIAASTKIDQFALH